MRIPRYIHGVQQLRGLKNSNLARKIKTKTQNTGVFSKERKERDEQ
jgi:hypothetical protein